MNRCVRGSEIGIVYVEIEIPRDDEVMWSCRSCCCGNVQISKKIRKWNWIMRAFGCVRFFRSVRKVMISVDVANSQFRV